MDCIVELMLLVVHVGARELDEDFITFLPIDNKTIECGMSVRVSGLSMPKRLTYATEGDGREREREWSRRN